MRTVIVEDVETAEAKKQRLATTAVDAALEILRTEASGLVIEAAAPLVFQGLCRRDNIRVEFTQTPMTNGRVIWLGPIDLGHKLASIYVYGHGCHERHHVMYTNFAAMKGIVDPGVRDLANVFEDIRVDKLGAADYEGYLLWRLVLFKAHESTGTAGWSNPNDLEPAHLFAMMLLTTLEFEVLGIDMFEEISANLRGECDRLFGPRPMARVLKIVRTSFPLDSTEAAVELAHKVMRCIRAEKNKALKAVEEAAGEGSTDNFEFRQGEGQSLLFDDGGAVTPEGDPRLMPPELEAINRNARCLSAISDQRQWPDREPEEESFRKLIGNGESGNGDPNFASPERHFANDREYPTLQPEKAAMNRRLFYRALANSASLRRLLQSALIHPQSNPDRLDERGEELDGDALALASTGETAVFRRELVRPGREAVVEIILDASGSMEGEAITLAKVACIRLLEALRAVTGVKASLTIFPGPNRRSVTCAADFNTPVSRALKHVDPSGVRCDADPSGALSLCDRSRSKTGAREDRLRHHRRLVPQGAGRQPRQGTGRPRHRRRNGRHRQAQHPKGEHHRQGRKDRRPSAGRCKGPFGPCGQAPRDRRIGETQGASEGTRLRLFDTTGIDGGLLLRRPVAVDSSIISLRFRLPA